MTDPSVYARLDGLQAALSRPTPSPLEGQEAIEVEDAQETPEDATPLTLW